MLRNSFYVKALLHGPFTEKISIQACSAILINNLERKFDAKVEMGGSRPIESD